MPVPLPDRPGWGDSRSCIRWGWVPTADLGAGEPGPLGRDPPGLIRHRWADENADQWPLSSLAACQHKTSAHRGARRSDPAEQVWKHGGSPDCDTVPFRDPTPMTGKRSGGPLKGGWERDPNGKKEIELNNAIFGFEAHCRSFQTVWEQAIGALGQEAGHHIAGPKLEQVYPVSPGRDRPAAVAGVPGSPARDDRRAGP